MTLRWAAITSGEIFQSLIGQLVLHLDPRARPFTWPGPDGAQDALFGDIETVYQAKFHARSDGRGRGAMSTERFRNRLEAAGRDAASKDFAATGTAVGLEPPARHARLLACFASVWTSHDRPSSRRQS